MIVMFNKNKRLSSNNNNRDLYQLQNKKLKIN